jgi:putative tryptophan/tyrosine transport system substrate-binding protein
VRRREFITLIGGAAAAWPLAAHAQRPAKIPRIGIIDEGPMRNASAAAGVVELPKF